MRFLLLILPLALPACDGYKGENDAFFCDYYDSCGKSKEKALYGSDHSLKEDQSLYKPSTELYGTNTSEDLYGKSN